MNPGKRENRKTHVIMLFIFFMIFVVLLSSPAWAAERDTLILKARQTSWKGNYDEAIAIYQQLINKNPKDIEAMLGLASVLSWQKKYQESSDVYRKIREIRPDIPDGDLGLLRLKAWQDEHAVAEEGLRVLHSKYPERFDILMPL